MKLKSLFAAQLASILVPSLVLAATPLMKEGLWEMTTTTVMPGMPFEIPPVTANHCYTKEELKDQQNYVPKQDDNCKITESKVSGNKFTWKVACTGKDKTTGEGEIVYHGTSYEGKMTTNGNGMKMTSRFKAKRVGDCQ